MAPNAFLGYKTDQRAMLDFSAIRSEGYIAQEQAAFQRERTIVKYRLFGRDGISEHEWKRLIEWGIAKPKKGEYGTEPAVKRIRVKKKIMKTKTDTTGAEREVLSEKTGDNDSAYTYENEYEYEDNDIGDPKVVNAGFDIIPLDEEIFGMSAAKESKRKRALIKL